MRRSIAGEALLGDAHFSERIPDVGVEPGADEHEVRIERRVHRAHDSLERRGVLGVAGAGRQRHVHRRANAVAGAALVGGAGPGIKWELV